MSGLLSNSGDDKSAVKPAGEKASADDLANFFAEPDDKGAKPDKEDKLDKEDKTDKDKDKDDKLDIDEDDIELKDEDEDDDKLDLEDKDKKAEDEIEINAPPKKKEILAKYPNFLKEFPFFEKMMYRDRQYTELFGSFDDARDVAERAQILDHFEGDLMKGNTETILKQVKETDKKAFDKLVDNYLPTLARVDKEAYFEVVGNIGKHLIAELVKEGKSLGVDENSKDAAAALRNAALTLNQFLFGTSTYSPPQQRVAKADEKDEELEQERTQYVRERFEDSRNELQTKVDNTLRATINDYIDRDSQMTGYVKKNAVRDALTMLHTAIGNDPAFRKNLDRLWESAFSSRFDRNSLDRIRSTYLGKAKNMLPAIIKKARAEALKDQTPSSRKERDEEKDEETTRKREPISSGRPRQQSGGKLKMERGESVLDFLSRD